MAQVVQGGTEAARRTEITSGGRCGERRSASEVVESLLHLCFTISLDRKPQGLNNTSQDLISLSKTPTKERRVCRYPRIRP